MGLRKRRVVSVIISAILIAACTVCLFAPFFTKSSARGETYLCEWSDGSVTRENYASALFCCSGISDDGNALLARGSLTGCVAFGEEFRRTYGTLGGGTLTEMLALGINGLSRLERAVLFTAFSDSLFYDGGFFYWNGRSLSRTNLCKVKQLYLLSGGLPRNALMHTGAEKLIVRDKAEITAAALTGSSVREVQAQFPYAYSEGALYRFGAGKKRLIAGLPASERLVVDCDTDFIDEGALAPCGNLSELALPFLGNAEDGSGETYVGGLGYLFAQGAVPETLFRVTVTGGCIISHAFYSCPNVREVNACGVPAENIAFDAFAGMDALETLHSPRGDLALDGEFTAESALCGCTVFCVKTVR